MERVDVSSDEELRRGENFTAVRVADRRAVRFPWNAFPANKMTSLLGAMKALTVEIRPLDARTPARTQREGKQSQPKVLAGCQGLTSQPRIRRSKPKSQLAMA